MRVKILGKCWDVQWVPKGESIPGIMNKSDHGVCQSPRVKGKKIFLREGLSPVETLDAVLHELLHAADWDKDDEWVTDAGHDLARAVFRILPSMRPS